jgi:phytanoyl-CoA hydroxylase
MYIMKPGRIGGKVEAHQDSTFIMTDPPRSIGIWLALDDARVDNACMYAISESHTHDILQFWSRGPIGMINNFGIFVLSYQAVDK